MVIEQSKSWLWQDFCPRGPWTCTLLCGMVTGNVSHHFKTIDILLNQNMYWFEWQKRKIPKNNPRAAFSFIFSVMITHLWMCKAYWLTSVLIDNFPLRLAYFRWFLHKKCESQTICVFKGDEESCLQSLASLLNF